MEQVDYDAVPEVVWECFVAQYGLKSGQVRITCLVDRDIHRR